jgi:hypothetical protein
MGRMEVQPNTYLTLAIDEGEWSASHTGSFTPREKSPGTQWIGCWAGPRANSRWGGLTLGDQIKYGLLMIKETLLVVLMNKAFIHFSETCIFQMKQNC